MPTPDQSRLSDARAKPFVMELWWALQPLTSVVRFMQSGAHPDDEISGMLAALAFRDGINLSYACSTRGEGGQNDIGTESGPALGALRTKEMERACDILGMRLYWHSQSADDTITDFGFSKSGVETLAHWGTDRTLLRFVEIVRQDRPDILCPTFLDVPGQHGHHRAMTQMAHEVMTAAADPGFPVNLPPWTISKLYLPAWSGAGQSYDDDVPPPPATLVIDGQGHEPVSGWDWERIGQMSRAYHRTQGMGRWTPADTHRDYPLHLAQSIVPGPDKTVFAGLSRTVGDLANVPTAAPVAALLKDAQSTIDKALAAFPDPRAVARAAEATVSRLSHAIDALPTAENDGIRHRLHDKLDQLGRVLMLCHRIEVRGRVTDPFLPQGSSTPLTVEVSAGTALLSNLRYDLPLGWSITDDVLHLSETAQLTDPYPDTYDPIHPTAPCVRFDLSVDDAILPLRVPFDVAPVVIPAVVASVAPEGAIINRAKDQRTVDVSIVPAPGVELKLPEGWRTSDGGANTELTAPEDVQKGLFRIPLLRRGRPAQTVLPIAHPHVSAVAVARPAVLRVRVMDAVIPNVHVGYIGGGNDRVGSWLSAIGANVTAVTDEDLSSAHGLAQFDTLVVGIFAFRFRRGLIEAVPRLHRWTKAGGTLLTLYHRPWDNWDPDVVPPKRLEIGQPSLRWRVTDAAAHVRHLVDHPVLSSPNKIDPTDWEGWVKERGLYFAKSWDPAYVPLVEMADPDESPQQGALLAADIGAGRHVHTSLILHHQMENLVPGAFRLLANVIARRT